MLKRCLIAHFVLVYLDLNFGFCFEFFVMFSKYNGGKRFLLGTFSSVNTITRTSSRQQTKMVLWLGASLQDDDIHILHRATFSYILNRFFYPYIFNAHAEVWSCAVLFRFSYPFSFGHHIFYSRMNFQMNQFLFPT